ncbi:TlpA family protein disulfide reductase [Streptomyces sp. NPDC093591]|uniref:TlpA family protein disulfide reductase n=1 Tax=Streptomyces sp. NPDC093591 TaxID=3366044 RepID=UPI0037FA7196
MSVLAAAVTFAIALGLLNLTLSYGVIRRLRSEKRSTPALPFPVTDAESLGTAVQEFSIRTEDGREISDRTLPEDTVVAFFSPGCGPCAELLPHFVETLAHNRRPVEKVLAVVVPGTENAEAYTDALSTVATVVTGDLARTVEAAFGVNAYPVVCRVRGTGELTALARDLRELTLPVTV